MNLFGSLMSGAPVGLPTQPQGRASTVKEAVRAKLAMKPAKRTRHAAPPPETVRPPEPPQVRMEGFEQTGSARLYRFSRRKPEGGHQTVLVGIEHDMFSKGRLSFQDGPAVCFRVLSTAPVEAGDPVRIMVTDEDIDAFVDQETPPALTPLQRATAAREISPSTAGR